MNVEIPQDIRDTAAQLGGGVSYALKVLAGQLADDPDMGRPSGLPGILTVTVDGELFEECPALIIGYIREADRIEIRYLNPAPSPTVKIQERDQESSVGTVAPAADVVTAREVTDAWRRVAGWLEHHAPASHAALRAGAGPADIAALEEELGIRVPSELSVLWTLIAGDDGVNSRGCLPGNRALMSLEAVAAVYRLKTDAQVQQDRLNASRPEEEQVTVWKASWIPVVALGPADSTSGLYLDTATGYLGRWSRYNEGPGEERETLVSYLEDAADMLEAPALAANDKPGLADGALVWLSSIDPAQEDRWRPLAG
ncbi:hypothetical protein [Streptomyces sp. TLI_105]|uniref:hypothetical protein n=1 Tax=Streptomyces sp. TLI_105 TaxID=1881019 RepID=UPI00089B65EA|nr:hypothetical protein [Streptomyces sp. TLI_105]SEE61996.1 Cell wall assembly regulator SMI1 [Streptomyces sp. TLI_105]